jgi:GT2 family glycosyltransferase
MVLVTYNRKQLLLNLLKILPKQTYPISGIVLVNNASSDGTENALVEMGFTDQPVTDLMVESIWQNIRTYYYSSSVNTGGSGGFAKAFEIVKDLPYDCVWAMDDDVSPDPDCLETLMQHLDDQAELCLPNRNDENWDDFAITGYNLTNPFLLRLDRFKTKIPADRIPEPYVCIEDMPLEGPLMTMNLIRKIGVPNQEYFIMFDDTDYAHRASMHTELRYVKAAHLHRLLASKTEKEAKDTDWNWKTYYLMRNMFYFDRKYGKNIFVRYLRPWLIRMARITKGRLKKKAYRVNITKIAYRDAMSGRMGKRITPGADLTRF